MQMGSAWLRPGQALTSAGRLAGAEFGGSAVNTGLPECIFEAWLSTLSAVHAGGGGRLCRPGRGGGSGARVHGALPAARPTAGCRDAPVCLLPAAS